MKLCLDRPVAIAAGAPRVRRSRKLAASTWMVTLLGFLIGPPSRGSEPDRSSPKPIKTVKSASASAPATAPTFTKDVAPILQKRCQSCHRKGQVAPFGLETYEQARKRSSDIVNVTASRTMPPWKPDPGIGPKLKHDPSLSASELAILKAWAEAGAPKGDPKDMPPCKKVSDDWSLGKPDLVLETLEDFNVPASGPDVYRCFVIPTGLNRDVYLSAVEYRPGNRRVVHHMQAYIDTSGLGRDRDAAEPGPGYTSYSGPGVEIDGDLAGWTPGNAPMHLPDGIGRLLHAGSDVILQVHYHPSGKPEVDRTRIGLYFSKTPVKRSLHWSNATNHDFKLAAGNPNAEVKATWFVPVDVETLGVTPHMHALGRDFLMSVTFPNGRSKDLLYIADWDPSWQDTYYFEKPVTLPKGSTVRVTAHFDNSSHPRNPNSPPRVVKWGPSVNDEMCVGYIGVVKKNQDLTDPAEKDDLFDILLKQHVKNMYRDEAMRRKR